MIESINPILSVMNSNAMPKNEIHAASFQDILKNEMLDVNNNMLKSEHMMENFALGNETSLPAVMSAIGKTKMSFEMMIQVRNHLLDGYKEIIRMQV